MIYTAELHDKKIVLEGGQCAREGCEAPVQLTVEDRNIADGLRLALGNAGGLLQKLGASTLGVDADELLDTGIPIEGARLCEECQMEVLGDELLAQVEDGGPRRERETLAALGAWLRGLLSHYRAGEAEAVADAIRDELPGKIRELERLHGDEPTEDEGDDRGS